MFSEAVPIAAGFTRPMVISSRTTEGACGSTIGAYVVVNREGWILTAAHLLEIVRQHQESARRYQGYRGNVVEFHRDMAADKRFRKRGVRTFHRPAASSVRDHSVWWGTDDARLVEARLAPAADLALVGGRHLHPDPSLAHRGEQPVLGLQHRRRCGGGGQAGDDRVRGLHHPRRALPPVRARVQKRPRGGAIEVSHRQVESVAQQRAGELAADVAKPDEADPHALVLPLL